VEQQPKRKRRGRSYELLLGLKLTEKYNRRWQELGERLGRLK